ncbi:uncharacterized protein CANTADRAFT_44377 [Suhomyces tanzawaensis NRRL Y-17324]|uniref:rRNA methyltransferase 2, mitochondrial n=1 Tax=Suhomyces tanzawaensis NRRL Y-17324 TaxID=984487 RepID=A0A1E4SRB2_9ASCO|nr:uncharacterized protein CANTADRAFT_44377 [Suhomyces tanzawaensis NRRL Y-17324]ODV81942.1 hypothetical protein CANTADRAFT_44377 [Suhomyces tanzawaensis NRRL Y-17324]
MICVQRIHVRLLSRSLVRFARGSEIGNERIKNPSTNKATTRQQRIDAINMRTQSKLFKVDNEFAIFDHSVQKVLDLGCVPGNWMAYSKFRLCQLHNLQEENFNEKCHILGFDLLFGTPPPGVSLIQGNIFSKMAHENILTHFKEIALRDLDRNTKIEETDFNDLYYYKEQHETALEQEIDRLAKNMGRLSVVDIPAEVVHQGKLKRNQLLQSIEYRPDLILSDLGKPFMQQDGFFNQTNSRPYQRYHLNDSLNRPTHEPLKSSIDLADASLFLCGNVLKPKGTMVLRLARVSPSDPELSLLHSRLESVFGTVTKWSNETKIKDNVDEDEIFFICKDKRKDSEFDLKKMFYL